MVNHHLWCRGRKQRVGHAVDTLGLVEVEAENEVGVAQQRAREVGMLGGIHQLLCAGKLHQQSRSGVRDDAPHVLAEAVEHVGKSERRAHGVAVGPHMADDSYFGSIGQQVAQAPHIFFFNDS